MGWPHVAAIIGAFTAMVGLHSFWIGRALDALRSEMHRGFDATAQRFDRVEARLDRMEGREPPSLRRV